MKRKLAPRHLTVALFAVLLFSLFLVQMLKPDGAVSDAERRPLEQKPTLSFESISNGEYFEDYETYLLDQAVLRDAFRSIKALSSYHLFFKKDNNDIYAYKGALYEILRTKESSFERAGDKIESLSEKLAALHCYYAIIPDKNALIATESKRPSISIKVAEAILDSRIESARYLDLTSVLSVEDYYRTDLHWRQERLLPIAEVLLLGMNNDAVQYSYQKKTLYGFRGVYYGQSALMPKADELCYLFSNELENVTVVDLTTGKSVKLYNEEAFVDIDPYNLFVGGPRSLLKITNPDVTNGKTLYLFRDSFASSLSPLLLCGYSEIVLIDLRYIDSRALDSFVTFKEGQDVLFLYSTHILNESAMLR